MDAMRQSRWTSLIEAVANVAVGYLVALAAQLVVFPAVGVAVSLGQNLVIGAAFSVVSIVRSYTLRRAFEAIRVRRAPRGTAAPAGRRPEDGGRSVADAVDPAALLLLGGDGEAEPLLQRAGHGAADGVRLMPPPAGRHIIPMPGLCRCRLVSV
jgi:hypothetical protein